MSLNMFFGLKLVALVFFVGILGFSQSITSQVQKPIYFAPPYLIKYFAFGFSDLYADLLWLRLIQDIDFCNSQIGIPVYDGNKQYQCNKGWSYKVTDAVTELAPRFLKPYEVGASIMSVIMGDKEGAKRIYDKGVSRFPEEWRLHFGAAYHYLVELKDQQTAAELLIHSANKGGPQWLYALAAKQYGEMGKYILAQKVLKDFLRRDTKGQYRKAIQKRLKKIEQKLITHEF